MDDLFEDFHYFCVCVASSGRKIDDLFEDFHYFGAEVPGGSPKSFISREASSWVPPYDGSKIDRFEEEFDIKS